MMEMPQVGKHHEKLAVFAGSWTGEETMMPSPWDPEGGQATAKIRSKIACDGFVLVQDYEQKRGKKVSFRGHGVFGYDAQKKAYFMFWFDSMGGGVEPAWGKWSGKRLTFMQTLPSGTAKYVFAAEDEKTYTFRMDHSVDGEKWSKMMVGRYTKV